MNDKPMILRVKRDDRGAFRELYFKYVQKLYVFVLRTAKSPGLAEDVVHDVFVKVWENRDKLDPDKCFQAWLFTVGRNHLLNIIRRSAHEKKIVEEMMVYAHLEQNQTDQQVLFNENIGLLKQAIGQLPEKRRQIFELCHSQGLTYIEAANQLNISPATVNSQMVKARKFIREYLQKENAICLPE